jgi:hypothetical protein
VSVDPRVQRWLARRQVHLGSHLAAVVIALFISLTLPLPAVAWSGGGHRLIARLAAAKAPAELPDFFRGGSNEIAAASVEPDTLRLRALPQLRGREYPEHYIDLELLEGTPLAESRYEFLDQLYKKSLRPTNVGMVPYAIVEATQHLAVALAEHRLRPDDPAIRARVLYRAGVLSHYSADMVQPLHTTVHHDGRAREDGSSPGTGIHHRVDPLLTRTGAVFSPAPGVAWPQAVPQLMPEVVETLDRSHALVDQVYDLEDSLDWDEGTEPAGEVREFANERLTEAVLFTARLFATSWELSAEIEQIFSSQRQAE